MRLSHPENFNIELATTVLDHVTANPRAHRQDIVMHPCGTQGCIAGWTLAFYEGDRRALWYRDGSREDAARDLLGLSHREADKLFSGARSAHNARGMLASFMKQAIRYEERAEEKRQRACDRTLRKQLRLATIARKLRREQTEDRVIEKIPQKVGVSDDERHLLCFMSGDDRQTCRGEREAATDNPLVVGGGRRHERRRAHLDDAHDP